MSNQQPAPNRPANLPRAEGAAYNSDGAIKRQCLPKTRVNILQEIFAWADRSDQSRIFWLRGIAGTGKSTIAATIAHRLEENTQLGASFFFSKNKADRSRATEVFTELAFQLAKVQYLGQPIHDAIAENPGIAKQSLYNQWKRLIFEPVSKLQANSNSKPLVFVLDALDECNDDGDIQCILQFLAEVQMLKGIQLRIFITSRPETPIRLGFDKMPGILHQDLDLHDISPSIINNDISIFFEFKFNEIRDKLSVAADWPGEQTIGRLVQSSGRLFIWAETACRFIDQGGGKFAQSRLDALLNNSPETKPEKALDKIYTTVLERSVKDAYTESEKETHCKLVRDTLGAIVTLFSPLPTVFLAKLLNLPHNDVHHTLMDLCSILELPKGQDQPIGLHHPSFRDFLLDNKRCQDSQFSVVKKEAHYILAKNCIRILDQGLKRNICCLQSPGALATDVPDDDKRNCLPGELQYACRYWVDHFLQAEPSLSDEEDLCLFLKEHFLHWLEALAILGCISDGVTMITELDSMLSVCIARIYKLLLFANTGRLSMREKQVLRKPLDRK